MLELAPTPALEAGLRVSRPMVSVTVLALRTMVRLQLSRRSLSDVASIRIFGTPLPSNPNHCAGEDPIVWWLTPESWLLVSSQRDGAGLTAAARGACGTRVASATDVSDSLVGLEIAGGAARELLRRGTGVDFSAESLIPGQCTRTRFAQLPVLLRPVAAERFELLVDRGPAEWLCSWLADGAKSL